MNSDDDRQGRSNQAATDGPTHPHLQATLLMVGIVVFILLVAVLDAR
ncbi:hypothetical protein [Ilumatobacter coccineus]|nr:hypothetical protein [Ilumatobacter coccineus]